MLETVSQKITRWNVQIALGVLWVIDGLLQLQHRMFTPAFIHEVIAPAADGQPRFVSGVMHFWSNFFLHQPFVFNSLIVLIQVGIGILLIRKSTVKYGIIYSIVWGLFVWYVGEGLGGLASGQTSLLMGAPGAALLYALIAFAVWPAESETGREANRPAAWLGYAWVALWLGGALLQLMAGQNTTADLSLMIRSMADGAPGWLAELDLHVAKSLQGHGNWVIALLVIVQALIGLLALLPRRVRALGITLGIALSLVFWVIGQSLGEYYTGLATDPSTAPLIILLGLAVLNSKEVKLELL